MISDEDLDLLDETRVVDALGRRYGCFVFVGARDKAVIDDNQIVTMRTSYDGDRLRAIGLCHFMAARISREISDDMNDED